MSYILLFTSHLLYVYSIKLHTLLDLISLLVIFLGGGLQKDGFDRIALKFISRYERSRILLLFGNFLKNGLIIFLYFFV